MSEGSSSTLWRWFVEGIAITIPLVLTLMILLFVLDFILGMLSPVVGAVDLLWPRAVRRPRCSSSCRRSPR